MGLLDGDTSGLGTLIDNIMLFIANLFGGLAGFGTSFGIILGVTFVVGLFLVLIGKIQIKKIVGTVKP